MKTYDVIVIGGGGSGLTAALYTSRAKLSTLLLEKLAPGGQIAMTDIVENYPGFPEGISGPEISMRIEEQAKKYGTEVLYKEVISLEVRNGGFLIKTAQEEFAGRSVITASGASFKMLNVPGEKELIGRGVSYCATCDGAFFKEKTIAVVGGGDSALQEGLFLTRFAKEVVIIHRRDQLRASAILQERAKKHPKISFLWDTVVDRIIGDKKVTALELKNVKTGQKKEWTADGIFIFIGHSPNTSFLKGFLELDSNGYVVTREGLKTSVSGVFAAGEVRQGAVKQLVAACGEGCEAALSAQAFLEHHA